MEEQKKEYSVPLMLTPEEIEDLREDLRQASAWIRVKLAEQESNPDIRDK